MPWDKSKYPKNWKHIREAILARENHCCKFCGLKNHSWIVRLEGGAPYPPPFAYLLTREEVEAMMPGRKPVRIILTIAHIENPDPMDVRPENLAALCQQCHLRHDAPLKAKRRKNKQCANTTPNY